MEQNISAWSHTHLLPRHAPLRLHVSLGTTQNVSKVPHHHTQTLPPPFAMEVSHDYPPHQRQPLCRLCMLISLGVSPRQQWRLVADTAAAAAVLRIEVHMVTLQVATPPSDSRLVSDRTDCCDSASIREPRVKRAVTRPGRFCLLAPTSSVLCLSDALADGCPGRTVALQCVAPLPRKSIIAMIG